ncbi:hypothetical protein MIND_00656400 [Mycena indigotica]|uniref:F-box domain-containing protein n=1 Tax=Mycena indigotica TaxID=2126181 RepID=A0A8H6SJP4_9AGAR|nr:uncharacterized protein MIND_00656400 [Mycena indigotica]KAF7300935.1 hypothetical protein MIND_00656400 [Mycena indigotica]
MLSCLELLPPELVHLILDALSRILYSAKNVQEDFSRDCAVSLATVSHRLRATVLPWMFATIHNRHESLPPRALWSHFRTLHIRDVSASRNAAIVVSDALLMALAEMSHLTTVTIRLNSVIPDLCFSALSQLPLLSSLEIYQIRLDGEVNFARMTLPALEALSLRIGGFFGVSRPANVDLAQEAQNIMHLLCTVAQKLRFFTISGDILPPAFGEIHWPGLISLAITEHLPPTHIPLSALVGQMPSLEKLELLYTPDLARRRYSPFRVIRPGETVPSQVLQRLSVLSLSNVHIYDPILQALPQNLKKLNLLAAWDVLDYQRLAPPPFGSPPMGWMGEYRVSYLQWTSLLSQASFPNLTALSMTIGPPSPAAVLIEAIASAAPNVLDLEFRHTIYDNSDDRLLTIDFIDPGFFTALRKFHQLDRFCIFIDYLRIHMNPGPPGHAAYRLFVEVPTLQTVVYKFSGYVSPPQSQMTCVWGREMLARPAPPRVIRDLVLEGPAYSHIEDSD